MAELPEPHLTFSGGCPDCGERIVVLPLPVPGVEDDFDWQTRDYDGFRLYMMQELASRFPERRRWTAADMEVVIVEVLAAALDRASHALDRVQGERFLDTARRPQSVRRLLQLIGWHPDRALMKRLRDDEATKQRSSGTNPDDMPSVPDDRLLENYWSKYPQAMEAARVDGPRRIGEQRRMVTLEDHAMTLRGHPFVALARARLVWSGAWTTVLLSVLLRDELDLDEPLHDATAPAAVPHRLRPALWDEIVEFHQREALPLPSVDERLTGRRLLRGLVEARRTIGSEVLLESAKPAAVTISLSVRAKTGFFRSELRQALAQLFTADEGGFFEPGRLGFGQALYASDVIEAAMQVEGVQVACVNVFRRLGRGYSDQTAEGVITVAKDEFIRCMSDRHHPEGGAIRITVSAGETA